MKNLLSNTLVVLLTCLTIWQNQQLLQIEQAKPPTKQETKKSVKSELQEVLEEYRVKTKELTRIVDEFEAKRPHKYSGSAGTGY